MQMIRSIQAVRTFAALSIIWVHIRAEMLGTPVLYGVTEASFKIPEVFYNLLSSGVDAFFIISGVIITTQWWNKFGTGAQWEFLRRRVARLMPTYWIYMVITLIWLLINHFFFAGKAVNWTKFFYSIFLAPTEAGFEGLFLGQAWTLHFEIYFYFLIFLALFLPRIFLIPFVGSVIACAVYFITYAPDSDVILVYVISSSLTFEVFYGVLIGALYSCGARVPAWLCRAALGLSLALFIHAYNYPLLLPRSIQWGIPAALLVFGLLFLERLGRLRVPQMLVDLGTSSYTIYLAHVTILLILGRIFYELGLPRFLQADMFAALCAITAFAAGHWLCLHVDKPIAAVARRLAMGNDPQKGQASKRAAFSSETDNRTTT